MPKLAASYRPIAVLRPKEHIDYDGQMIDFRFNIYYFDSSFILISRVIPYNNGKVGESEMVTATFDSLESLKQGLSNSMNIFEPFQRDIFFFSEEVTEEDYHNYALWDLKLND